MGLSGAGVGLAAFLASAVELVEALTIVLAVGSVRGWRSALWGAGLALVVLAVAVAALGTGVTGVVSRHWLQLVAGALLLIFGLQWLRKAIFRSAGLIALHDEDAAFAQERESARGAPQDRRLGLDWFAFTVSFKGTLLEGLEVVFIVVGFAATAANRAPAVIGAAAAAVLVVALGVALHRPLARVPENTIKYAVGLMLSTFGVFWLVEGLNAVAPARETIEWPGGEAALPVILGLWIASSALLIAALRANVPEPA